MVGILCVAKQDVPPSRAMRFFGIVVMLGFSFMLPGQTAQYGVGLDGAPVKDLAKRGTQAVVLFFAASDCPISNRYFPELMRLKGEFGSRGVEFWYVYPNPGDTAAVVKQHIVQFDNAEHVSVDREQSLVRMAGVTVTPEAAVFRRDGNDLREVYHGRIDDRYVALGNERPRAFHHDLEEAIASTLENKPALKPGGPPVGCAIVTRHP